MSRSLLAAPLATDDNRLIFLIFASISLGQYIRLIWTRELTSEAFRVQGNDDTGSKVVRATRHLSPVLLALETCPDMFTSLNILLLKLIKNHPEYIRE